MGPMKKDKSELNQLLESDPPRTDEAASGTGKPPRSSMPSRVRGDGEDESVPSSDRRRFLVKLSLFGAASAAAYATPQVAAAQGGAGLSPQSLAISGTGTITTDCGTSTYAFSGSASYTLAIDVVEILSLLLTGQFVSGLNIGPVRVENVGALTGPVNPADTYSASGTVAYTDDFNDAIPVDTTLGGGIADGMIETIGGTGEGIAVCGDMGEFSTSVFFSAGACYITTAVTQHLGLSDDCHYLRVLRDFRDRYIVGSSNPERIADLHLYYTIAPDVVKAIELHADATQLWEEVAATVRESVRAIESGHESRAYELFKKDILGLQKRLILAEGVEDEART